MSTVLSLEPEKIEISEFKELSSIAVKKKRCFWGYFHPAGCCLDHTWACFIMLS